VSAERVIANLLRIAREDLEGARVLNARGNRNAIYLCEQAAEKIIRAVLTSERVHAGVRHQLDEMVGLVPDENPLKPALRALQHLSTYATSYRYTTPTGRIPADPPTKDVEATAEAIEATLLEAASRFGIDLAAVDKPATTSAPIR
jgi:HEPN domain-containing protein